jgi:enoyl-CoA hydratase
MIDTARYFPSALLPACLKGFPAVTEPSVLYAAVDGFATITLDSPGNRNAISERMLGELRASLRSAAADDQVRAIVLAHTGNTFCAGADLSVADGETRTPAQISAATTRQMTELLRDMLELPKPIVACINGHVRAGGMGIVAACDLAVAGPQSSFALTEARLGLAPAIISLTLLPRLNSRAASRYFLTGEQFGGPQAQEMGLITLAAADANAAANELIAELGKGSPQGLAESKALTTHDILHAFDERAEKLSVLSAKLFTSPDAAEGILSFLQRRPPNWVLGHAPVAAGEKS